MEMGIRYPGTRALGGRPHLALACRITLEGQLWFGHAEMMQEGQEMC